MAKSGKRIKIKRSKKIGLSPGHLMFTGEQKHETVGIDLIDYDLERLTEMKLEDINEAAHCKDSPQVSWIDVNGLHDVSIIEQLGKIFEIHALVLEDILNADQRPKVDFFEDHVYMVFNMLTYHQEDKKIEYEQISLLFGKNYLISFQERPGDVFEAVRERIRAGKVRLRNSGPDYLAYALLDVVVDHYFLILEKFGEDIEAFEEALMENPRTDLLHSIYHLKREMLYLRKSVWPLREVITRLEKSETELIEQKTMVYLRDVYDHTIQVIENIEIYRDTISGLLDLYLSSVSYKMNEVMKTLTVIGAIFIPLTFIVGVYGMNFDHIPELHWVNGYYIIWGIMVLLAVGMLLYFRSKHWLK
jgi:magnesium transporter